MKLTFNISTQRILRECITQTSLDLQAIRSRGNELSSAADTIYPDWTMNEDNLPEIYTPLEGIGAKLCQALKRHVVAYAPAVDMTTIQLCVADAYNGVDAVMDAAILRYYKYSLLAWWYLYRDTSLSQVYEASANEALDEIKDSLMPRSSKIIPHYF